MYLPDEVMWVVEEKLLPLCIWTNEEELDNDELVRWAVEIINKQLDGKNSNKLNNHWNGLIQ